MLAKFSIAPGIYALLLLQIYWIFGCLVTNIIEFLYLVCIGMLHYPLYLQLSIYLYLTIICPKVCMIFPELSYL